MIRAQPHVYDLLPPGHPSRYGRVTNRFKA
jgi:hypothetical protein